MKKGLTHEPSRKMVALDHRTIIFYDPRIEDARGNRLPRPTVKNRRRKGA